MADVRKELRNEVKEGDIRLDAVTDPDRLQILLEAGLQETTADEAFNRFTHLAARLLNAPLALFFIVDDEREYCKSVYGLEDLPEPNLLSAAACGLIRTGQPIRITGREKEPAQPLFAPAGTVASLTTPLITNDGWVIGCLCVADRQIREWTDADLKALTDLNATILSEVQMRRWKASAERNAASAFMIEAEYRPEHDVLRNVVDNLKDVVFQTDNLGRWTLLNPAWEELTGFPVAESLGKVFLDYVHPDDRERNNLLFLPLIARQKEYCRHSIRYLRQDGGYRWVEVFARLTLDANDNTIGTSGTLTDISERQENEERLHAQNDFNQAILETVGNLVMVLDRNGHLFAFNRACAEMTGVTSEEALGKPLWTMPFYPQEERENAERFWAELDEEWTPRIYEAPLLDKNGNPRILQWANTCLRDEQGRVRFVISAGVDVTERNIFEAEQQQTLAALEKANRHIQQITDTAPNIIYIFDLKERRNLWSNREIVSVLGITPEMTEALGNELFEIILHPEDILRVEKHFERLHHLQAGEIAELEYRARNTNGDWRWLRSRDTVFQRDAEGNVTQILGTAEDITQRRESEEALRRSEARLAALISNFYAGVLVEDENRRVVLANRLFCDLFQIPAPPEVLIGADCDEAAEGAKALFADPDGFITRVNAILKNREPVLTEEIKLASGTVMERDYVPIRINGGYRGHLWLYRDITQRKLAEERLQALTRELQRSNGELDHFASVASHDLQEPLRKIQMFGSRLQSEAGETLPDNCQNYLKSILNASRRMSNLITDLLRFSRITSKARPFLQVDLAQVLQEVLEDLEPRLRETDARLDVDLLPVVEADITQMHQLFQNLIGNALKFRRMEVPLSIQIKVEAMKREDESAYQFTIVDNGIGFEPEYNEQIFEVFERLHDQRTYEGTGIGLAICRKIIERHRGTITATGESGKGSTFTFVLPVTQPAPKPVL